jgi:hypothetical protein
MTELPAAEFALAAFDDANALATLEAADLEAAHSERAAIEKTVNELRAIIEAAPQQVYHKRPAVMRAQAGVA